MNILTILFGTFFLKNSYFGGVLIKIRMMNNEIFQTIMAVTFFCFFTKNEKDKKNSMCISNQALHVGKKEDVEKRKMTKSFCVYVHAGFLGTYHLL